MINHNTPFSSKFFGLGATVCIAFLLFGAQWDDYNRVPNKATDPNAVRNERLTRSLNHQLDAEARAEAAQLYCGNAGWKLSEDGKSLTCIPRKGKPYQAKAVL